MCGVKQMFTLQGSHSYFTPRPWICMTSRPRSEIASRGAGPAFWWGRDTLHLTPYTLHLTPYPLHLAPSILHIAPCTLHLAPRTLHLSRRSPVHSRVLPSIPGGPPGPGQAPDPPRPPRDGDGDGDGKNTHRTTQKSKHRSLWPMLLALLIPKP